MDETIFSSEDSDALMLGTIARKHRDRNRCYNVKAYCTVVGGFIFMLFAGSVYVTGNIDPYIASYYQLEDTTKTANILPSILVINVFIMPFGTALVQRGWDPKKMIFAGGTIAIVCLFTATMFHQSFTAFFILYVLAFAFNQGLTYMVPIHHAWLFFPKNAGLISGIILAGYGFGAFIFDQISTAVINPNGDIVDEHGWYPAEVNANFEHMMRVLIVSWAVCILVGVALIFEGPAKKKRPALPERPSTERPYTGASNQYSGSDNQQRSSSEQQHSYSHGLAPTNEVSNVSEEAFNTKSSVQVSYMLPEKQPKEFTMKQMCFSKPFILLYIMNACSIMTGFFAVNNFKTYGLANGITNDQFLASLGSAAAICNSVRFLWSWATDYLPYKLVYAFMLLIQIGLNFTMSLVATNNALYAVWICGMLLCEGGHFTLVPNVLKKIYGDRATQLYGILFSYTGVCSVAMIILQDEFLTKEASSYDVFFYINGGLSVAALLLLVFLFSEEKFGQ